MEGEKREAVERARGVDWRKIQKQGERGTIKFNRRIIGLPEKKGRKREF